MRVLFRWLLSQSKSIPVRAWSGTSTVALALAFLSVDLDSTGKILLIALLSFLLIGGVFLVAHGIIDLVKDIRRAIHHPRPPT
jgi:hypothetical protein